MVVVSLGMIVPIHVDSLPSVWAHCPYAVQMAVTNHTATARRVAKVATSCACLTAKAVNGGGGCGHPPMAGAPRTPTGVPSFDEIADVILQHAREYHQMGKWKISLFLVMPDHLHFIMHVPNVGGGVRGAPALPGGESGVRGAPALPRVIANWKHWLTARYGIAFQANFRDTRLRDEAHYADKFRSLCLQQSRAEGTVRVGPRMASGNSVRPRIG